ncbi:hypothetical protein ABEB36_006738 [Hypothenemus hampei]|uniref:Tyrosine-protein phosphatase non-receptor type 23 n=1 Tax=Hypothenemus hampei TaxID=57062 RepID=A0ABD1ERL7_HYPHA
MEAAPRLPMIIFDMLTSPESVQFGKKLKPYIASFYNENPDNFTTEINKLDTLRSVATHPSKDLAGLQYLKQYYCQLHFLKSRFPMEPGQLCFIEFEWKDCLNGTSSGGINFELMAILYNIGVLHTILGAHESRSSPESMKLACSHFQCASWAFERIKSNYSDQLMLITSMEVPHFYKQVCLAQAQECILEKSMLDNRKSTIIAKVAVQVWDFYRQVLGSLKTINEDVLGRAKYKDWLKFLSFKISYHRCISLLFQGQQAEEMQKMGERVAFYQGACDYLQEAAQQLTSKQQKELGDALAFAMDVVEGKRKAAKNENEFIYHEEVPDLANLQEVKGACLVKGIEFNINDPEVSGPDIFERLVPMEAHEASSIYSEKKAEILREFGQKVEIHDQALAEFMSSLQLDILTKMHQATGITQELIDRAASLSAMPRAILDLVDAMARLSNIYHDVEGNLNEIDALLKEEEENERSYQESMGKRPSSIITTDLAREASKYKEAHAKAKESNETLSKAMMTHLENLKILQRPLRELQQKLPSVEFPDVNIDQAALKELELLTSKVDEMKTQRAILWSQLRESIRNDDITNALVTKQSGQSLEEVFQTQLEKHNHLIRLLEQNLSAQENIKKALVDCYAKSVKTRRYIQEIIQKRNSTIQALIVSHDSYNDLLAKALKGIEFYTKLELNVSKLLQRIKSAAKVQQEEREQLLAQSIAKKELDNPVVSAVASAPKLKDYLEARKKYSNLNYDSSNVWPPAVRPAPLGSEITTGDNQSATTYFQPEDPSVAQITHRLNALNTYENYSQDSLKASTTTTNTYQTISTVGQYYQQQPQTAISHHSTPVQYSYTATSQNNYPLSATQQPTVTTPQYYSPNDATQMPTAQDYQTYYNAVAPKQTEATPYLQNYSQFATAQTSFGIGSQQHSNPVVTSQYYNTVVPHNIYSQAYLGGQQLYSQSTEQQLPKTSLATSTQSYSDTATTQSIHVPTSQYSGNTATYPPNLNTGPMTYNQNYSEQKQLQYYPQGYSPNYINPCNNLSQNTQEMTYYHPQYYTQQHLSSVPSNVVNYQGYSTYSSPTGDLPNIQPNSQLGSYMSTMETKSVPTVATTAGQPSYSYDFSATANAPTLMPELKIEKTHEEIVEVQNHKPESKKIESSDVNAKKSVVRVLSSKALNNVEVKRLFSQEWEKFEKFVESLTTKTLNGPTVLETIWKDIQNTHEREKKIISVARCYPMKNRFPDILPYDFSRLELRTTPDDYINATYISQLSPYSPEYIVTQAPLPNTMGDFWAMIREHQVELIVCLLNDEELNNDVYWPQEKGRNLTVLNDTLVVSLQSVVVKPNWTERIISLTSPPTRECWTVMHLQFTSWPGSLFPKSPEGFVNLATEAINTFEHQKNLAHPILVHCSSGIGRSGCLCLLIEIILETTNLSKDTLPDLIALAIKLEGFRKNIFRDREHLKFIYESFLFHMKCLLGIKPEVRKVDVPEEVENKLDSEQMKTGDSQDPLSSLDPFWVTKK